MKQQQEYDISIEEMVSAGIFETEEKAINEAIKSLLKENPEIKKRVAIYMYDNEEISLERAAEIAGVCYEDMKLILVENGIKLRLGPIDQ